MVGMEWNIGLIRYIGIPAFIHGSDVPLEIFRSSLINQRYYLAVSVHRVGAHFPSVLKQMYHGYRKII